MNAKGIASVLVSVDGITIDRSGHEPTTGYVVAIADSLIDPTIDQAAQWVAEHPAADYFGSWRDEATGMVYLDAVAVTDRETATRIATDRHEIAIWHIDTGSEIRI